MQRDLLPIIEGSQVQADMPCVMTCLCHLLVVCMNVLALCYYIMPNKFHCCGCESLRR